MTTTINAPESLGRTQGGHTGGPSPRKSRYDKEAVRAAAEVRWPEVIASLGRVDERILDGGHHPCPKCGGTDRFNLNREGSGGAFCNQCFTSKNGDGFATIMWLTGEDFATVLKRVAEYCGVKPSKGSDKPEPAKHLTFHPWSPTLAGLWCLSKPPIKPEVIQSIGGRIATYRGQYTVIAIPVWGPSLSEADPVGWVMYRTDGGELPKWTKGSKEPSWVKVKLTVGSSAGIICSVETELFDCSPVWKTEGPTDLLAILSTEVSSPPTAFTTANGAGEKPPKWIVKRLAGKTVYVVHDADRPGQQGATWVEKRNGRRRPGWCPVLAESVAEVRNVQLPFPIEANHGPDLRDFFAGGGSMGRLLEIAEGADPIEPMSGGEGDGSTESLYRLDQELDSGRTDLANAQRFVDRYHAELLSVPRWGRWLAWDGQRWADDDGVGARQRAKRYVESLWRELPKVASRLDDKEIAKVCGYIKASSQAAKIEAFMRLAASDERVVCKVDELNCDPLLLNVANGTIDLSTGELRSHNSADRITQLAPVNYDPEATCPKWMETLKIVFDDDAALISYVQRLLGYSISGDTGEHILPICYGSGHNGKSTIWNTVLELLGDYASLGNESLLLGDKHSHPTEIAFLYQKRFVPISEPERGAKFRESRVKELTGERTITARRMKEDFWSFIRTHTFWLSTNHLPRITGRDEGMWRRVKLIPFTVDIRKKVDAPIKDFDHWLVRNEGPGILAWLVRGYLNYRQEGLTEPEAVTARTQSFREDSDPLKDFLDECCEIGEGFEASAAELFAAYSDEENFGGKWTKTAFGRAMAERFEKRKPTSGQYRNKKTYLGVSLKPSPPPERESDDEDNSEKNGENSKCAQLRPVAPSFPVTPEASYTRRGNNRQN